ncbi:MAG: class I SAM-dependent methyltransferase [Roseiflexaceae bacterium]|nr:class I SAM-dependent methyltransferase [Roseiflexaceae bacterium]
MDRAGWHAALWPFDFLPRATARVSEDCVQDTLDRLSENPQAWNVLRSLVEAGFRGEKAAIARELDPWRDVGARAFLDFGCGTGEFAPCFPPQHYTGVDLAAHYVRWASRHRPGYYAVADGTALALHSASFDAALVCGVFHHLPDEIVRGAVAELHRVLKPAAVMLVLEDIAPPDAWNLAGKAMHWLDRGGFIRSNADYRALMAPHFQPSREYSIRSGICDYAVYVMQRAELRH